MGIGHNLKFALYVMCPAHNSENTIFGYTHFGFSDSAST
jgi:hypothetical protein